MGVIAAVGAVPMRRKRHGVGLALAMLAAVPACAPESLRPLPRVPLESIRSHATVGAVEIAVEPLETDAKTQSILDKPLISAGVLPVLVVLCNRGAVVYALNPNAIWLLTPDGERRAAATTGRVARATGKSETDPESRDALAVTSSVLAPISLPLLPWYIANEAAQAHNKGLAREYLALGLPHYIPQGETRGVVFFPIPKGTTITLTGYWLRFAQFGPRDTAAPPPIDIPLVPAGTP